MSRSATTRIGSGIAAAAVAASLTTAPAQAGPEEDGQPPPPAEFGACPQDLAEQYPQLRCAGVDVPVDYSNPGGEHIRLLVSRLPARDPAQRRGTLVVNPGGPGGPGASFAGQLAGEVPAAVRDHYDLVGFDTRHSAHSAPISCVDPEEYWTPPLPDPDSPADRAQNWQRAEEYAAGCSERAGQYLPHLTTPNNARDMDRVRAALGEQHISYLGYSYGTYLGAVYGELFGQRVDRMILDSAVDPTREQLWYDTILDQDVAVQHRLERYFRWAAEHDDALGLGGSAAQVREHWQGVLQQLRQGPHGQLGPSEFVETTFNALYGESDWVPLAEAIGRFRQGDDRPLIDMVEPKDRAAENANAIYNAVECADSPWPAHRAEWERDAAEMAEDHPLAAWYNSWTVAPCRTWDAPAREPVEITGEDLPPVLVVNSEHDVATPHEGARAMHRALPSSVMVTEEDAGKHGVFALAGNAQVDRIGTDYLVGGEVPPHDRSVPGHSPPDPSGKSADERSVDLPLVGPLG